MQLVRARIGRSFWELRYPSTCKTDPRLQGTRWRDTPPHRKGLELSSNLLFLSYLPPPVCELGAIDTFPERQESRRGNSCIIRRNNVVASLVWFGGSYMILEDIYSCGPKVCSYLTPVRSLTARSLSTPNFCHTTSILKFGASSERSSRSQVRTYFWATRVIKLVSRQIGKTA